MKTIFLQYKVLPIITTPEFRKFSLVHVDYFTKNTRLIGYGNYAIRSFIVENRQELALIYFFVPAIGHLTILPQYPIDHPYCLHVLF